jgi:predicted phage terminase large subunit-like protein
MTILDRAEFDLLTRLDLYTFVQRVHAELNPGEPFLENWHVELMAAELMAVWRGEERRLIFNLPPRNLKSLCISVAFVAWVLGHDPTRRFMVVSYGQELAEKLGRDTRAVMMAPWYRTLFPGTVLSPVRQSAHDFETTLGGGRLAVSRGGPITGRGAHYIIMDDPIKADEALSDLARETANNYVGSTLATRRNDPRHVAFILCMQRLHEDDLTGRLIKAGGWRQICLPAVAQADEVWTYQTPFGARRVVRAAGEVLHEAREPRSSLDEVRQMQGEYHYTAQYLQNPIPLAGNQIPIEKFGRYDPAEVPAVFDEVILSLDTAYKDNDMADYSVSTHWGRKDGRIYLRGVWRMKATYFELKVKLRALFEQIRPHRILIEDCASGQSLIQDFTSDGVFGITACAARTSKQVRMMEASIMIEGGQVYIPTEAPWLGDYLHELAAFPHGRHDDQVDSTSQALNWFRAPRGAAGWMAFMKEKSEQAHVKPRLLDPDRPWRGYAPPGRAKAA